MGLFPCQPQSSEIVLGFVADSSEATGLKWQAPAGGAFPTFRAYRETSNQTVTANVITKIAFNAESWDTAGAFDSTTNYRFTPLTAGYYQLNSSVRFDQSATSRNVFHFYKNGASYLITADNDLRGSGAGEQVVKGSTLMHFNGSTDYAEIFLLTNQNVDVLFSATGTQTAFDGIGIQ